MRWISWLFIGISIAAAFYVIWFLGSQYEAGIENPLRVSRSLFWILILLILTPALGIVVGLLTKTAH